MYIYIYIRGVIQVRIHPPVRWIKKTLCSLLERPGSQPGRSAPFSGESLQVFRSHNITLHLPSSRVKFALEPAMKAQRRSRGTVLIFL